MEDKLPWQLTRLISSITSKSNERIELHTNRHIPLERSTFITEPHLFKAIDQIAWDVFVKGGLDLLKDEGEVVQARYHHVETSNSLVGTDFFIVKVYFDWKLTIPKFTSEFVVDSLAVDSMSSSSKVRMRLCIWTITCSWTIVHD